MPVVVGVQRDGERIDAMLVETKSGRRAIRARWFVDATGDADLAHHAGVPYELGDGHGDALYPSTMFRVGGVDAERALAAIGSFGAIDALMREAADRYDFPREGAIVRPQRNRSEWRVNVTQVANAQGRAVDATDAVQLSAGEVEGRRQVIEYLRFLRAEVPGFERAELIDVGTQLGVRETRRVQGAYRLRGDDVLNGARFDDSIGLERVADRAPCAGSRRVGVCARCEQRVQPVAVAHADPAASQQPAGRRPLCVDGTRRPVGCAGQRRVLS